LSLVVGDVLSSITVDTAFIVRIVSLLLNDWQLLFLAEPLVHNLPVSRTLGNGFGWFSYSGSSRSSHHAIPLNCSVFFFKFPREASRYVILGLPIFPKPWGSRNNGDQRDGHFAS
jgi:uncharacterized membrane protein YbjE (DUF340 family)